MDACKAHCVETENCVGIEYNVQGSACWDLPAFLKWPGCIDLQSESESAKTEKRAHTGQKNARNMSALTYHDIACNCAYCLRPITCFLCSWRRLRRVDGAKCGLEMEGSRPRKAVIQFGWSPTYSQRSECLWLTINQPFSEHQPTIKSPNQSINQSVNYSVEEAGVQGNTPCLIQPLKTFLLSCQQEFFLSATSETLALVVSVHVLVCNFVTMWLWN